MEKENRDDRSEKVDNRVFCGKCDCEMVDIGYGIMECPKCKKIVETMGFN